MLSALLTLLTGGADAADCMGDRDARMQSVVVEFHGCKPINPEITINGQPYTLTADDRNPRRFTTPIVSTNIRTALLDARADNVRAQCSVPHRSARWVNNACEATFVVECESTWDLDVEHQRATHFSFYVETGPLARSCHPKARPVRASRTTDTSIGGIGATDSVVLVLPDQKNQPVEYEITYERLRGFGRKPARLHEIGARSGSGNPAPGMSGREVSKELSKKTADLKVKIATEDAKQ